MVENISAQGHKSWGHSWSVGSRTYGVTSTDMTKVTTEDMAIGYMQSVAWGKLLIGDRATGTTEHLTPLTPTPMSKLSSTVSDATSMTATTYNVIKVTAVAAANLTARLYRGDGRWHPRSPEVPELSPAEELRVLLAFRQLATNMKVPPSSDGEIHYKDPVQKQFCSTLFFPEKLANHHVLVVGKTGVGKTMAFLLGASVPGTWIDIYMPPLTTLAAEVYETARLAHIPVVHFGVSHSIHVEDSDGGLPDPPANYAGVRLLIISPQHMDSPAARDLATSLNASGRLRYVFVDEAHRVFRWADFRPDLSIESLMLFHQMERVSLVFISATFPPWMELQLRDKLKAILTIRAPSTARPDLRYFRITIPDGDDIDGYIIRLLQCVQNCSARMKAIVYVNTLVEGEQLRQRLQDSEFVAVFIHGRLDTETKIGDARRFSTDNTVSVAVATLAFGEGVNTPATIVIHRQISQTMIDHCQGQGRLRGHNGSTDMPVILVSQTSYKEQLASTFRLSSRDAQEIALRNEMIRYSERTRECCRALISSAMDDGSVRSCFGSFDVLCHTCLALLFAEDPTASQRLLRPVPTSVTALLVRHVVLGQELPSISRLSAEDTSGAVATVPTSFTSAPANGLFAGDDDLEEAMRLIPKSTFAVTSADTLIDSVSTGLTVEEAVSVGLFGTAPINPRVQDRPSDINIDVVAIFGEVTTWLGELRSTCYVCFLENEPTSASVLHSVRD